MTVRGHGSPSGRCFGTILVWYRTKQVLKRPSPGSPQAALNGKLSSGNIQQQ